MKNLVKIMIFIGIVCFVNLNAKENDILSGGVEAKMPKTGEEIYNYWCLPCHGANMPGTNALQALYQGLIPAELTKRDDLNPELVEFFVRDGKHSMPFFRKVEINDEDLKALGKYLSKE